MSSPEHDPLIVQQARDVAECAAIVGMPPATNRTEALARVIMFGEGEIYEKAMESLATRTEPYQMSDTNSVRDRLKAKSKQLTREEEFEAGGEKFVAIGLMTGARNRLTGQTSNARTGDIRLPEFSPLLIAMCVHYADTREKVWNENDPEHIKEINELDAEITDPMFAASSKVCGWGKEAVKAGKLASEIPTTNSDSSSPES